MDGKLWIVAGVWDAMASAVELPFQFGFYYLVELEIIETWAFRLALPFVFVRELLGIRVLNAREFNKSAIVDLVNDLPDPHPLPPSSKTIKLIRRDKTANHTKLINLISFYDF